MNPKQLEKVMQLVEQYTAARLKYERWQSMALNGISYYLMRHDEIFGWGTYWTRFYRLQSYAAGKMAAYQRRQEDIAKKIAEACGEGA